MPFIDQTDQREIMQNAIPDENIRLPGFGETFAASLGNTIDENLSISMTLNREGWQRRKQLIEEKISQGVIDRKAYLDRRGRFDYDRAASFLNDPQIKTDKVLTEERNQMLAERRQYSEAIMEKGNGIAQFLGAANAYMLDPISIATMPISMPATGAKALSIAGRALLAARNAAVVEIATELAIQPFVYEHRHDIDSPYTYMDALENIAGAAIGSSVLGGVTGGVSGYLRKVMDATQANGVMSKEVGFSVDALFRLKETIDYGRANRETLDIVTSDYDEFTKGVFKNAQAAIGNTVKQLEEKLEQLRKPTGDAVIGATGAIDMFEDQLSQAKIAQSSGVEADIKAFYKQAREVDVQSDIAYLNELEIQRRKSGAPSRTKAQYERPAIADTPAPSPMTATSRERFVLENQGLEKSYDMDMQKFKELESPRIVDNEGNVLDANEVMKKFDEELDGIESILTCAYG